MGRRRRAHLLVEASLLLDRAMAALGAMDMRSLRLAADVLDVIARGSDDRSET